MQGQSYILTFLVGSTSSFRASESEQGPSTRFGVLQASKLILNNGWIPENQETGNRSNARESKHELVLGYSRHGRRLATIGHSAFLNATSLRSSGTAITCVSGTMVLQLW